MKGHVVLTHHCTQEWLGERERGGVDCPYLSHYITIYSPPPLKEKNQKKKKKKTSNKKEKEILK